MNFQELIQIVKESLYCQICGMSFDDKNVELAGYKENILYFHAFCDKGHTPSNSLIKAVAPVGLKIGDLIDKFFGPPITYDNFLDLKNALKTFDGNFEIALQ